MDHSLDWWIVFLELLVVIGVCMLAVGNGLAKRFRLPIGGYAFINAALLCLLAHTQVQNSYQGRNSHNNDDVKASQTIAAGAVASLVFLFIWIPMALSEEPMAVGCVDLPVRGTVTPASTSSPAAKH